jgi:uncharacterized protein (DUF1800 family)
MKMLSEKSAIAANRFGLGARVNDAELIGSDPRGWLVAQLETPAAAAPSSAGPPESARVLQATRDLRAARQLAARLRANASASGPRRRPEARPAPFGTGPEDAPQTGSSTPANGPGTGAQSAVQPGAVRELVQFVRDHYVEQVAERNRRAIETERPFAERLVQFWSNHFAISADKQFLGALAGLYEQEAIAPHVTGNFLDLLLAVERHPAMLLYLDNAISMGPDSMAASFAARRGRKLGLNENLAREIMELHTLGVNGGYDQHDVTEFAKVLTGWSIGAQAQGGGRFGARGPLGQGGPPGEFYFRPVMHEPGDKTVLGTRYAEQGAREGEDVLKALARHPATARHLATKLARHFVADEPPAKLVDRLAATYLRNDGELKPVYRELIAADESWRTPLAKYKTPQDFVISTYRALGHTPNNLQQVTAFLSELGQRPFTPGSPAGWPDTAASWDGGDALLKRIEWGAAVGRAIGDRLEPVPLAEAVLGEVASKSTLASIRNAESGKQAMALLIASPEFQRR